MKRVACLLLAVVPLLAHGGDPPVCCGPAFGTTYRVVLAREPEGLPLAAVHREVEAVIARVDRAASAWRDDSDVSRFNRAAAGAWVDVGRDLVAIVEAGRRIHEASHGAFDMTVTGAGTPAAGMELIEVRQVPPALRKARDGLALDLGGIGPGYAVDVIGSRLVEIGSRDHLVELGGEVRAWGCRPDGGAWRVRVAAAAGNAIDLEDGMALATSTARPGRSPIDPRTGGVVACRVPSATVRTTSCADADAWAVAALVLGLEADSDGVIALPAALRGR